LVVSAAAAVAFIDVDGGIKLEPSRVLLFGGVVIVADVDAANAVVIDAPLPTVGDVDNRPTYALPLFVPPFM
jgi:hypothetical protein